MNIFGISGASGFFSKSLEGAQRSASAIEKSAAKIAKGDLSPRNSIQATVSHRIYTSNLKVIEVENEVVGKTLDLTA